MTAAQETPLRILLLEDNEDDVRLVQRELSRLEREFEFIHVDSREEFEQQLMDFSPDIVLADHSLPGYSGEAALAYCRAHAEHIPFIFVSGTMGEEVAIEALQKGAVDYVLKQRLQRLRPAVARAWREAQERAATRQAQAELRHTQRLLQSLIEYNPTLISVRDLAGRFLITNGPFKDRFVQPEAAKDELTLESLVPVKGLAGFMAHDRAVLDQKMPVVREHTLGFRDGDQTFLSVRFPLQDDQGRVEAICGIDMDISDRKHSEERLREQANILDQASDAIFVADQQGKFTYCNQAAEEKLGWSKAETLGRPVSELFPDFTPSWIAGLAPTTSGKGGWRGEIKFFNRKQELLIMDVGFTRILKVNSDEPTFAMICTDITEQKRLAEQFLRVQRLENLGMLAAGIAHDLNNVLSPIGMVATLLRPRLSEERDQHFLDILEQSTNRGAGMVRQILSFAHGVSGELHEVQVKHLLRDVVAMIRETFPKNIVVDDVVPKDLQVVRGDPTQIHQVVLNLCVNARDAMAEKGGTLLVEAENVTLDGTARQILPQSSPGDWIKIEIADTGAGIVPEILTEIWSPFFSTKAPDKGTGLGLPTVRGIVERHSGFIHVESTPGSGSTFQVYLPAVGQPRTTDAPFDLSAAKLGRGERILVVDDEKLITDMATEALTQQGYSVITSNDSEEAAKIILQKPGDIELLLTDMMMPKVDGVELIGTLKSLNHRAQAIVMTGMDLTEVRRDPRLDSLVASFIKKPFEISDLLQAVAKALSGLPATDA